MRIVCALLWLALLAPGCGLFWEEVGEEGQPCASRNGHSVCRPGLSCLRGMCVDPDRPDGDTADGDPDGGDAADLIDESDELDPMDQSDQWDQEQEGVPFEGGAVLGSIPAPAASCAGLVRDDGSFWVGDLSGGRLVRIDAATGGELDRIDFVTASLADLAFDGERLYSLHAAQDAVWAIDRDSGAASRSGLTFRQLKGIAWTGSRVAVWSSNKIDLRTAGELDSVGVRTCEAAGSLLAHAGDRYYLFHEALYDGLRFSAIVQALDATHPVAAAVVDSWQIPINAQAITGLEAEGDRLWLLASGSGSDSGRIFEIRLDR